MPTIASLSKRLGMTAEEAVTILRKLHYEIADVETVIDDDQTDILVEVSEDPDALAKLVAKRAKEEELKARKAKSAAKKAASSSKPKKKSPDEEESEIIAEIIVDPAPIIETPVEESAPTTAPDTPGAPEVIDPATESSEKIVEEAPSAPEIIPSVEIVAPVVSDAVETAPPVESVVVESPSVVEAAPVAEIPAPPAEISAPPVEEKITPQEEVKEEAAVSTVETVPVVAAPHHLAEIINEEEFSELTAASKDKDKSSSHRTEDSTQEPLGALAEAERLHRQSEQRRAQREKDKEHKRERKEDRPLSVPDPEVVRMVIQKDLERKARKAGHHHGGDHAPRGGSGGNAANSGGGNSTTGGASTREPAVGSSRHKSPTTVEVGGESKSGVERKSLSKTAKQKQKKSAERARVIEENMRREAAAAVREFQSGGSTVGGKKRRRRHRDDGDIGDEGNMKQGGAIEIEDKVTVERLANLMEVPVTELILELMDLNILATKNQILELDLVRQVAESHGFEVTVAIPEEEQLFADEPDDPADLVTRPPVVTVMGHVDHGKTTLLDKIRTAKVAEGEAGGITQHIAAYHVELPTGGVTFLDTPGHEAFTHMRARGAHVTDVVVLVVAANDGVMPQTIEAIDHAKAAEVPIVVAVNKCDMPAAQPDRVRQELTQYGLLAEAWGGKTIMKNISAKAGTGVDDLMELLALQADMMELKANPKKRARGAIIESEITIGQGPVAWVLVQNGTLRVGDAFLAGTTYGRVRSMTNSRGEEIHEAGPSMPVVVTGFNAPPDAGDVFVAAEDERLARNIAEKRAAAARLKRGPTVKHMTLEDFHARVIGAEQKILNVIIKADVQGSVDVLISSFSKLGNEEVKVAIVHSGVGAVNESDILLASASDAVIIGFHVTANTKAKRLAEQEGVDIRTYRIIYEALDEVKKALEGLLAPDKKEVVIGHIEVRRVFHSSALGNIAGCYILDGEAHRGSQARLTRDGVIIYEGKIESLRREKDDAKTVLAGFECGVKLDRYEDVQVNDIIEVFRIDQVAKSLS